MSNIVGVHNVSAASLETVSSGDAVVEEYQVLSFSEDKYAIYTEQQYGNWTKNEEDGTIDISYRDFWAGDYLFQPKFKSSDDYDPEYTRGTGG